MATKYKFNKYQGIYDSDVVVYGLAEDGVEVMIDNVKYIEVSPDFQRVQRVRADSLKVIGSVTKEF